MVTPVAAENLLCVGTDAVAVVYDMEMLDFRQEGQCCAVAPSIAEQGQGLTDNIPGDIQSGTSFNRVRRKTIRLLVVNIPRIKTGIEKDVSQNRRGGSAINGPLRRNRKGIR